MKLLVILNSKITLPISVRIRQNEPITTVCLLAPYHLSLIMKLN